MKNLGIVTLVLGMLISDAIVCYHAKSYFQQAETKYVEAIEASKLSEVFIRESIETNKTILKETLTIKAEVAKIAARKLGAIGEAPEESKQ